MMMDKHTIKGVYAITPDEPDDQVLLRMVRDALDGGIQILQYRNKQLDFDSKLRQASKIKQLCDVKHIPFLINDDIEICRILDAFGVHLGANDDNLTTARKILGPAKCIGVSCYNQIERVRMGLDQGADYIALGAFFPTSTKPNAPRMTNEILQEVKKICPLPIVAIGGISKANAADLIKLGVDAIAVIQSIFSSDDIIQAVDDLNQLFKNH